MSVSIIKRVLKSHSEALQNVNAEEGADLLSAISDGLPTKGTLQSHLDKRAQITDEKQADPQTVQLKQLLTDLYAVLEPAAKKNVTADLGRLIDFIERHISMSLSEILKLINSKPVETDLVETYGSELKRCMGEDGFEDLLEKVLADRRVKQPDLWNIARFLGSDLPKKAPKKRIADRLKARHDALVTLEAKRRAMAGRSAA